MKTDKKKLMRKLIAVGLMASMLTANTMTYGSSLILPSINAEAFSAEAETKLASITETYDISALAESFDSIAAGKDYIEIVIDQSGTYKFTGTNYKTDGDCYIDVQVTVDAGVEANFIFDNCTILNNGKIMESGVEPVYPEEAFVINGTVNIYIKKTSKIAMYDTYDKEENVNSNVITFTGDGTVNVMESEDKDQWLKISEINTSSLNVYGGNLSTNAVKSANFKTTDGMVFSNYWDNFLYFMRSTSITYEGGNVCGQNAKYGFYILPENGVQLTDINGIKQEHAYLSNDGMLYTYHDEEFSAGNAPYIVAGGELFVFTDFEDMYFDTPVSLGDPAKLDDLKITKEYDGTTGIGEQTIEQITMNGYTLTPDLSKVTLPGSDVGEYTAKVPFTFKHEGNDYTFYYSVPAEITAKEITATITAKNKVYDKSAKADVEVTFEGLADSDKLTEDVDYTITAEFADENVGTGKTVTATITLAETVKNYTLEETTYEATADITAAPLTITGATVENKAYDGEKTANVTEVKLDGVIDGDVVDYTATAEFADEKIGTGKGVTVTVALKNANYALAKATYETTADIIAKGVTIADVVVESKTYDAKTDAKVTSVTFKNEKGEVIPLEYEATAAFADAAAGKGKEVTVTVTLKDSTYTLTESKFTAKADINFAGETKFVSYESVEDKPSLPKADNFVDKEVNGEGLIVVKSPKIETKDYYFAYLVKSEKFKIGNAAPKTGTFYVALNDKGEKTRKFTVSIPFTTVIIDGKTYKAPDGYAYYAFGITDVPTEYDLHCSENIELN